MKKKSLRAMAIASGKKINKDIYFNKKRRKELKNIFLKSQKTILENKDFSAKPVLKEEYDQRMLVTSILAFTVTGLETIEKAEEFDKRVILTKCKFILYKKGESSIFKSTFLKSLLDNKKRTSYLYFPQGFPKTSKKKVFIYKGGKQASLKGYEEEDLGSFQQKVLDYKVIGLKYRGKKATYNFKLTIINDQRQLYWAEKLFVIKRS